jgi:hypothetical protein
MRKIRFILPLALAYEMFAGGFWLQLGNPEANAEARQKNAVLVIKATGCHDPATAEVTATAIGMVDGRRQTIALKVTPLTEPGAFALAQQWPAGGHWVIELVGRNGEQFTNTLVSAGPAGIDRVHSKADMKPFREADVEAMLGK